jgi:predicted anti-sigma-YlaC factor YlaD
LPGVTCDRWRDAISARLDGETTGVDERLLDAHLAHCAACRSFAAALPDGPAAGRIGVATDMPDLSRRVAKLAAAADRAASWSFVRILLAVVAVEVIAFSVPDLLGDDAGASSAHDARHLGAFTVAYGVALLVVVVRPARARAVLPVAVVLTGALVIGAVVDLVQGRVPIVDETRHLPELLSVVLLWLVAARGPRGRALAGRPSPYDSPMMSVVEPETDSKSLTLTRTDTSQAPANGRSTEAS